MPETPVQFLGWQYPLRKEKVPVPLLLGFPCGSESKESACNVGNLEFDPWFGKTPWKRAWQPTLVYLCGESPLAEEPCRQQNEQDWAAKHSVYGKWCWGPYLQSPHRGTDTEKDLDDAAGEGGGANWEASRDMHALLRCTFPVVAFVCFKISFIYF